MNKTRIPWTDFTWNPVTGCTKISEGCQNCYCRAMEKRFGWETAVTPHPERLEEPLKLKKPARIFVCSMADLFHDDVPLQTIAEVFNVMACATVECGKRHEHEEECWTGKPHTFQVLTKRPARMLKVLTEELPDYVGNHWPGDAPLSVALEMQWPLPNVWLGVTCENQQRADERIPLLLQVPAKVRFVSVEPMLEWMHLWTYMRDGLSWVIAGSESGPKRRPAQENWFRQLRDECKYFDVPFFYKQAEINGKILETPELEGVRWTQFPK